MGMRPNLIGITGKAGAGKDTAAQYFVEAHGYVQYSLAHPIKAALSCMFGWPMEKWDDRDWKEAVIPSIGKSPRQCAQTLGTEWGRELICTDLWLVLAEQFIQQSKEPVVISDVRFDNEADMIRLLGGEVIEVTRAGVGGVSEHLSESGVEDWLIDWEFKNDGTVDELHHKLWKVFK